MELIQWLAQLNVNELTQASQQLQPQASQFQKLLSQSVNNLNSYDGVVFSVYLVMSVIIKRSLFLVAFFVSCMLFQLSIFDRLAESELYALTFCLYYYVSVCNALTCFQRIACVIMLALIVTLGYDSYFYWVDGAYGEAKTIIYNNIEYLALLAHMFIIGTLVPIKRINNTIKHIFDSIMCMSSHSFSFVVM